MNQLLTYRFCGAVARTGRRSRRCPTTCTGSSSRLSTISNTSVTSHRHTPRSAAPTTSTAISVLSCSRRSFASHPPLFTLEDFEGRRVKRGEDQGRTRIQIKQDQFRDDMKKLGRARQWKKALQMFRDAQGEGRMQMNAWMYAGLLHALASSGRAEESISVLCEMSEAGIVPTRSCFNSALYACAKSGDWETSEGLMVEMNRLAIAPDTSTHRNLMKAYAVAGKVDIVLSILDDLCSQSQEVHQMQPAAFHFEAAMLACTAVGQGNTSLGLLDRMREMLIDRNGGVYREAIQACMGSAQGEGGKANCERARNIVFKEMKEDKIQPNAVHYTKLIHVLGDGGHVAEAVELLDHTASMGRPLDTRMAAAAIGALGDAGEWGKAVLLLRTVSERRVHGPLVTCYIAAVEACARRGQWEKALELVRETTDPLKVRRLRNTLSAHWAAHKWAVYACSAAGEIDEAIKLVNEMPRINLRVCPKDHLEPVLSACLTSGDWEKALSVVARHKDQVVPNAAGFGAVALACGKAGEWETGLEVLRHAEEAGVRGISQEAIASVMMACTAARQPQRALGLLDEMRSRECSGGEIGKEVLAAGEAAANAAGDEGRTSNAL